MIARGAERCRGGKGCRDDCGWGLECVGSWSKVGDSWVLEVRKREYPPCVGNQHQRGYGGDRTPARERRGEGKGERNCGEEGALMDARWEDEEGDRDQILKNPKNDYTKRLISAVPVPDPKEQKIRREARLALKK